MSYTVEMQTCPNCGHCMNLSRLQKEILRTLAESSTPLYQSQLGAKLDSIPSSIIKSVGSLVKQGLVKWQDADVGVKVYLSITDKGRAYL